MSNNEIKVKVMPLEHAVGLNMPTYATKDSAGIDLTAAIEDALEIEPGQRALIPTGLCIALPSGYEAQIRPRSGLAYKHGITVLNTPGTIDADYRGEVKVLLINHGQDAFTVERGMRIAQMVVARYETAGWEMVKSLDETDRGEGGFGSTGTK